MSSRSQVAPTVADMSTLTHPVRRSGLATRRKALLTVHVVASVGLLGVSAGSLVSALFAATADDPQQAHAVLTS